MARQVSSPPPILSGYSYIRPLGTGGFADVFLFEQDMPRRSVAVKVMLKNVVDDSVIRMFNAEADVMAKLSSHPSILTVFQASISADGRPYLVMEYCPASITERYRVERMSVQEVLRIGVKIASALETAHRSNLLHRDVKPSNILVTSFGTPVLSDFGIATSLSGAGNQQFFAMSVPWSAPEVVSEQVTGTVASEVWSLGATVYSLLAGRSPFEIPVPGKNTRELIQSRILKAKYTPIDRTDVSPRLQALLKATMQKDPSLRPASALAVAQELQAIEYELGIAPTPLEVAADEWAAAGPQINFENSGLRGPVRPSVQYESSRVRKEKAVPERGRDLDEGTVIRGAQTSGPTVRTALIAWSIAGGVAVAATAGVVVALLLR